MPIHKITAFTRRLAALFLCAALCLPMAACGKDEEGGVALQEGETFTIAVSQEPDSLNPTVSAGGLTEEFFLLCYDPLWRVGVDDQPVPCIAEDWSLSSDGLTWTIRLRKDAVFSDGRPLTSADVLFSYDLMRHNQTVYTEYFEGVTAIRCPDDYTVVVSTSYVKNDMLYNPAPILPKHLWQEYEFNPADFENAKMVGSGPFVFCPEESGEDGWLFRSREEHFGGAPKAGAVMFAYYGTVTGAARALSAGEADASFGLTDVQLTTLEGVPDVRLIVTMLPQTESRALVFNTRSSFFDDVIMRQVVEYCCDRDWFLAMYSGGAGLTGSSFLSPGAENFAQINGIRGFDMEKAKSLLTYAGYIDVDEDGILEYGTRAEKLSLTLYTSDQDPWGSTAATILEEDLTQLGILVDWQKTEGPVTEVCGPDDSWDMCLYSWHGSQSAATVAATFMEQMQSLAGWYNPAFETALANFRSARDEATQQSYAQQMQQIAYDDCPVVVLAYGADIQAVRSDEWTGYEDVLNLAGGLFSIGSNDVYLSLAPKDDSEKESK